MYYLLSHFHMLWTIDPITSLDDIELERFIKLMKQFSPYDVFILHTADEAKTFAELLTTIADTYFGGILKEALTDFQNYLTTYGLDLIICLEEILELPIQDRSSAMDDLIIKLNGASKIFQGAHLAQSFTGKSGPLF
jgi:hypothetical protein